MMSSRVAIVGIGGLGSASSTYLARSGVGFLRLIDGDRVEVGNLHRTALFSPDDVDRPKAEVAEESIKKAVPSVELDAVVNELTKSNAESLLGDVDVVVDGLDNMRSRHVVNSACVRMGKPYVYGAVLAMEGNVSVFHAPDTPCLMCVTPGIDDTVIARPEDRGVLGPAPGLIGTIQAIEVIKLLAGIGGTLKGKLLMCDFTNMDFYAIQVSKRPECNTCGSGTQLGRESG